MEHSNDSYVIDASHYDYDRFYFWALNTFWILWVSFFTGLAIHYSTRENYFSYLWVIVALPAIGGLIHAPMSRKRKQIVEPVGDSIVIHGTGLFQSSKFKIKKKDIEFLTLEHFNEQDPESVYTLNLLQRIGPKPFRTMLASFVHPHQKEEILYELADFLRKSGVELKIKNQMEENNESNKTSLTTSEAPPPSS